MPTVHSFVFRKKPVMEKYELVKDIIVMYVPAESFPEGIQDAFENLESKLPSKDDRILFGISWPDENGKIMYKAAAEEKYKGEGKKYELDIFAIKKGIYASELVKDYKKNLSLIGITFQQLLKHPQLDTNSYCLEWYKGCDDVICLVKLDLEKEKQTENRAIQNK
jgi:predicted transcriptional regulator YdeE